MVAPGVRKRGGQPKPPDQRRVSLTMRLLPAAKAKALRMGRAAIERLIAEAPESRQGCQPTKSAGEARG